MIENARKQVHVCDTSVFRRNKRGQDKQKEEQNVNEKQLLVEIQSTRKQINNTTDAQYYLPCNP